MNNNRLYRLIGSMFAAILVMIILVSITPADNPPRILVMLGGVMPEGVIQGITYFLFFFGMTEIFSIFHFLEYENDAFHAHILPEKENWILGSEDVSELKLKVQSIEHSRKYLLTDIIIKACVKYRLAKSSSEVLGLVDAQVKNYNSEMDSEQTFIHYVAWAIPSVGFIGTVLGIAGSLGFANQASTPEGIKKVTDMLAVAFDTTLVSLVLSVILMYFIHDLQKKQESFFAKMGTYMIENFINRLYK